MLSSRSKTGWNSTLTSSSSRTDLIRDHSSRRFSVCNSRRSSCSATISATTRMKRMSRAFSVGSGSWLRQQSVPYRLPSQSRTGTPTYAPISASRVIGRSAVRGSCNASRMTLGKRPLSMRWQYVSTSGTCVCRSSATVSAPEPSGAGSGSVSHPRAVSRSAECWSSGSGGASRAASLPSSCVWACSVSQVSLQSP